ncbi:flagellar hook-associated protein FlgL [Clostridium frigidicarnis]|uniref:Flagellar hook-associated protein 3 FlgL n=1 Tax=Clostridium frigidicarnis TaxID=84698 RepID=A0A1I0VDL7_9CLOT|nr:flagellar hook-associated protein FlgL [Clostridium frigidicarnis]SFA74362.1 flagellar hook-associated protein 3 FlgL [Clostridium frigidicarnis]
MRVTNSMLSSNFLRDMRNNLETMQTLENQLTSGKEIRRPSDNPFKVARSMQLHGDILANKQYNENIKDTINWLDTTDTALNQTTNTLQRIRELMVSAGNGGYGTDERKAICDEINEKIGELGQVLNTNFDGKYVFGGTKGTSKPMAAVEDTDGRNHIVYATKDGNYLNSEGKLLKKTSEGKLEISGGEPEVVEPPNDPDKYKEEYMHISQDLATEISQGVTIEYNVTSRDIFEFKDSKGTNSNLMDLLNDITKNLNDPDGVSKLTGENLDDITKAMDNVLKIRSEVGAKQNRMDAAKEQNTEENFNLTDILSKTEDIDFVEKQMEFATMQTVYVASLQTSARVLQPSLMDYLR